MTHTKDEALKLASALDHWATQMDMGRKPDPKSLTRKASAELRRLQAELDAIKQALAAPTVQEPVALEMDGKQLTLGEALEEAIAATERSASKRLNAVLVAAKNALYTTPPAAQRQFVGLTDDQIEEMANDFEEGYVFLYRSFAQAIEAKLKELNT